VQVVDHLDDATVLGIDHVDAGVQIVLPDQKTHRSTSPPMVAFPAAPIHDVKHGGRGLRGH
jgi:hypothetical protein